jgi:hypothetical protein
VLKGGLLKGGVLERGVLEKGVLKGGVRTVERWKCARLNRIERGTAA